jgi:glucose-1-phosphatase
MTFLYDIGRVLLDFHFESSLVRLFPEGTPDVHDRLERLLARKDEFEAGRIDVDSYTKWAMGVLETDATAEQFHHYWQRIFTPNEPMWETVRNLSAKGHRLILFSNTNAIHCPWVFEFYPEFSIFDGAVLSFDTGFIKPEPEIYQHAMDKYHLVPDETLYIDDLPQNIATGKDFGFHCFQYDLKDHASFERWLATFPI